MIKNPNLKKVADQVMAKVPGPLQAQVEKTVIGGLKIMHSPQSHQMLVNQVNQPGDPADNAGQGVAKLVGIIYRMSKGKLSMKVLVSAGQILLCEALDFLEQAGKLQVDNQVIAEATKIFTSAFLQLFQVTPDKLQAMTQQAAAKQGSPAGQTPTPAPQTQPPAGLLAGAMQGA